MMGVHQMVKIVFFRHGRAEAKTSRVSDSERRLTERGKREVLGSAAALSCFKPARILSSPYRRAVETSEILSSRLGIAFEIVRWLAPGDEPGLEELFEKDIHEGTVLVGHNPWLEIVVTELAGGRIKLKPGGFAVLSVEAPQPGGGVLLALWTPDFAECC